MKKFFLLPLICLLLCSCARTGKVPVDAADSSLLWQKMLAYGSESAPYRIQFSLRFGEEGNTRRVTGILWGNDDKRLRMDIMAGVGATIARMEDSPDQFILYAPREQKAYAHDGAEKPLLKVGMPLPFNMSQLAALLNGHYNAVFGSASAEVKSIDGRPFFMLHNPPGGSLELDAEGRPETWRQANNGWQLELGYNDDSQLPARIKLTRGEKLAVIVVKDRENPGQAFDKAQMALEIPSNTPRLPLANYKPS